MSAHAEFLRAASNDASLAAQLKADFRKAKLSERDFRMLEFVEKLTQFPWLLVETDLKLLRRAGFSDSEILHIVLGSAHFSYLNRMADGIGIQFEYKTEVADFKPESAGRAPEPAHSPKEILNQERSNSEIAWIRFPDAGSNPELQAERPIYLYRVMGGNPAARDLAIEWRAYHLKETSMLDARTRARLALFISGLNRCDYSVYWFGKLLRELGTSPEEQERLAAGKLPPQLSAREQLLFKHAERLTVEPWMARERHIQELRQSGLDDHGILQLTMLCSYLSFENRVVLGLGMALESQ